LHNQNLMIRVCHMYYVGELTQQEIADRIRVSRVAVARLLKEAAAQGLVTFTIAQPTTYDERLARGLEHKLSIDRAVVVSPGTQPGGLIHSLGSGGARLLSEILRDGDTVGVSSGESVSAVARSCTPDITRQNLTVVQLVGSFTNIDNADSAANVARTLASALRSGVALLNAPAIVDTPGLRRALIEDSNIAATVNLFPQVNVALFGIGAIAPTLSSHLIRTGFVSEQETRDLVASGVVGDVLTRFVCENGEIQAGPLQGRVIAFEAEALRRVPFTVAVAGGVHKARAIKSAVSAGLVRMLVTDQDTANCIVGG